MAFTREQVEEFIEALHGDADLRERVRGAILSDDFQALPGLVRTLAERVDVLGERMDALTERMDALTERTDALTERMDALTERMDALTRRLEAFVEATLTQFRVVDKRLNDIAGRLGNLEGEVFEWRYDRQAAGRLGLRYRNVRVLRLGDEAEMHRALDDGRLSDDDWEDAIRTDCVVRGVSKASGEEVVLAIEVSKTVDESDITRANQRAGVLRKVWPVSIAAVDGDSILPDAKALALQLGVTILVRREASAPPAA